MDFRTHWIFSSPRRPLQPLQIEVDQFINTAKGIVEFCEHSKIILEIFLKFSLALFIFIGLKQQIKIVSSSTFNIWIFKIFDD